MRAALLSARDTRGWVLSPAPECSGPSAPGYVHLRPRAGVIHGRWHTTPFGTDTVFRRGGSLYDAGLRSRMDEYYNTSAGSAEFNALGNPLGFSTAPACVTGDDSTFVAVVDASVTAARADQLARLLIEGGFLHQRVRTNIPQSPIASLSLPASATALERSQGCVGMCGYSISRLRSGSDAEQACPPEWPPRTVRL